MPSVLADAWFLLGAPWDCSGSGRGEQAAPEALRQAGLLQLVGQDVGDAATVIASRERDQVSGVLALRDTVCAARSLAASLTAAISDVPGRRPLVVGGDCSILLGIVPALLGQGPLGLWFLDGHPDFLDGEASDTGETADMDLSVLTGQGPAPLIALAKSRPMIPAERVVLLGHRTRNLDSSAASEVARLPAELHRIDAEALVARPNAAGERAARWLARVGGDDNRRSIWLHLDLDVLNPDALPAVTYPQTGGPDWEQLALAMKPLARSPQLLGVSVADFRPDLDPTGELASRIVTLLDQTLA
jgi:arginase